MVAAYLVTPWLIVQVVETIFPAFGFGDAAVRITAVMLDIGLIPTLIPAWVFEWRPKPHGAIWDWLKGLNRTRSRLFGYRRTG